MGQNGVGGGVQWMVCIENEIKRKREDWAVIKKK